ncbi:MAG: hypothetical protein Q7T33_02685 [Dehalococcoidia bacterium]|nr:hypothetical protein [Dehalococcoidia bacterium]
MAERRPLNRKRIMRDFVLNELSAVDNPAQKHAVAVLMKRDKAEKRAPDSHEDDAVPADKAARVQESLRQFLGAVAEESAVIAETIAKSLSAVPALAELLPEDYGKGDDTMNDAEKKQMADLQKSVDDLTEKLAAATAKEPAKKAVELQEQLDAAKVQITEFTEKLAKSDAAKVEAEAVAKMSDAEKEHMAELSGADKMKFMQATPDERKKMMAKVADANPVVYKSESTGEEYRKNDDPRLAKLAKLADEDREVAKTEREKRESAELAKRADEEPYKHFSVEKAKDDKEGPTKTDVLRAISKMDEAPRAVLEKWLGIGGKAISAAFEKIGHSREGAQKSAADFSKRVNEIMVRDKISKKDALEKAPKEFPEEFKAYQESGAQVN